MHAHGLPSNQTALCCHPAKPTTRSSPKHHDRTTPRCRLRHPDRSTRHNHRTTQQHLRQRDRRLRQSHRHLPRTNRTTTIHVRCTPVHGVSQDGTATNQPGTQPTPPRQPARRTRLPSTLESSLRRTAIPADSRTTMKPKLCSCLAKRIMPVKPRCGEKPDEDDD